MFEIKNLYKRVGNFSLENIELSLEEGEFHVVLGPTGSGKTLLLETITGIRRQSRGSIIMNRRDISNLPPEKRGLSYVPQDLALFPNMNVKENILYGIRMSGKRVDSRSEYLDYLLEIAGIGSLLEREITSLSGGEKQRVALVRALAVSPSLLLLDEPLSSVHPALKWELQDLLKRINRELKIIMIMVTHDMDEAFSLGDRISILIGGRIKRNGRPKEVYSSPNSAEVARFLGFKNIFEGKIKARAGESIVLDSMDFGEIRVSPPCPIPAREGESLLWGIPSEEVTIIKPDRRFVQRVNQLKGVIVELYERGHLIVCRFLPSCSEKGLEITFPSYALRKLGIRKGQETEIELNPSKIFILNLGNGTES